MSPARDFSRPFRPLERWSSLTQGIGFGLIPGLESPGPLGRSVRLGDLRSQSLDKDRDNSNELNPNSGLHIKVIASQSLSTDQVNSYPNPLFPKVSCSPAMEAAVY